MSFARWSKLISVEDCREELGSGGANAGNEDGVRTLGAALLRIGRPPKRIDAMGRPRPRLAT